MTPRSWSHWPAGLQAGMTPAGEMWSVVTESPSTASTRAPLRGLMGAGSADRPLKNGGAAMYVEVSSQA